VIYVDNIGINSEQSKQCFQKRKMYKFIHKAVKKDIFI
jgi:hypothetical protein